MAKKNNMNDKMTLTDLSLVKKFQEGNLEAGAEFISNHLEEITKISRFHAHRICYDYAQGYDLKDDCVSEGVLAAYDAMKLYDFTGSSIMTFINAKIKFAFMTLKRNNSIHSERYELNADETIMNLEDTNEDSSQFYFKETLEKMLEQLDPESIEWSVARLMYNAMARGVKNPINDVAKQTGYTTMGVRNILKRTTKKLPVQLVNEIQTMLWAA